MDLDTTPELQAFRAEVRDWLRTHVPSHPLGSYDTREGFEQHRQWETELAAGGWSSPTWPRELGGRGCDLIQWLIFEEEYCAADPPSSHAYTHTHVRARTHTNTCIRTFSLSPPRARWGALPASAG